MPFSKSKIIFFISDLILVPLAVIFAFYLRFEGKVPSNYFEGGIQFFILINLLVIFFLFKIFKIYSLSFSYFSIFELIFLWRTIILGFAFSGLILFLLKNEKIFLGFPRSVLFLTYFFLATFLSLVRISKRIYLEALKGRKREKVLIVGSEKLAENLIRNLPFLPEALILTEKLKRGMNIHGIKAKGGVEEIPKVVKEKKISQIFVALDDLFQIKEAIEYARKAKIEKIKILPSYEKILKEEFSLSKLKEIKIEELLKREPLSIKEKEIEKFISGKKILITGGAGSIGSKLTFQIADFSPKILYLIDRNETALFNLTERLKEKFPQLNFSFQIADILDKKKMEKIFSQIKPQLVFHTAAYKHVPLMEKFPEEAIKNNVFGTKNLADLSLNYGVEKFIFISTDKAAFPKSVMGASKRIGEMICQILNRGGKTAFISVRFGNVLDSGGNVIEIFKKQIEKGGPIKITHPEMERYFMTAREASLLVLQAGALGRGGEVFFLDMGKPIKILDLAKEMIRLSGLQPDKDIPIVFTHRREGEKIKEKLFEKKEEKVATFSPQIYKLLSKKIDEKKIKEGLLKLEKSLKNLEREKMVEILKELVPTYEPDLF